MYIVERKDYGVKITFAGFIREKEMKAWQLEMVKLLKTLPDKFGMLIDMREMKAIPAESQQILMATQKIFKPHVLRSASITAAAITNMQFKRMGDKTKVNETKIFINALEVPNWEEVGETWIVKGTAPEEEGDA
ncbi:hypothetical protein [Aureispira anguillae]|uniref:Uncharacterized protein n=1 Tax=Aureispira anguillae TaxID=2864201 RepID=A0A915YGA9_9BACT|nr:hypothetical protein [Aureispira anguillae]BDS12438.1 hypothetical protein AsAng_0031590 [Aureispira anguillae]